MISTLAKSFDKIESNSARERMSMRNCLLAGFAMFSLKYPSLLQFDNDSRLNESKHHNLKSLYRLETVPSDTYMRERLDELDPDKLRRTFKPVIAELQHAGILKRYEYYEGCYLVPLDGTGYFYSDDIHCKDCCQKKHRDGKISYYHQFLSGVLVHPDEKVVIPLCPEPILKQDGVTKNDCERNAAKRLLRDLRREHPHLGIIIVEDSLASNGPHIDELIAQRMHFILGVKPKDHVYLFNWVAHAKTEEHLMADDHFRHRFRYVNQAPLSNSRPDLKVNFLEYWEENLKTGKIQHFSWLTDFILNKDNVYKMMRGGRARWKIENETFNTLKNQGYYFEHNFGHGSKHLSTVFGYLMFLAFLIDQIQQLSCSFFQKALIRLKTKSRFWEEWRNFFFSFLFDSWEDFLRAMAEGLKQQRPVFFNTS